MLPDLLLLTVVSSADEQLFGYASELRARKYQNEIQDASAGADVIRSLPREEVFVNLVRLNGLRAHKEGVELVKGWNHVAQGSNDPDKDKEDLISEDEVLHLPVKALANA